MNLAFALWYSVKGPDEEQMSSADPGIEMLAMVNESMKAAEHDSAPLDDDEETVEPTAKTSTAPSVASEPVVPDQQQKTSAQKPTRIVTKPTSRGENCYVMSLFDSRQSAEQASAELQQQGYQARLETRYSSKVTYLVYLPAYASAAEARKITRELEEKGQVDFQILTIKGQKNSISLGIYSQPHTAAIRQKQIEALGYEPVVEPVFGTPMGFQLEFNKPDISRLTSSEKRRLVDYFKNRTILPQKCSS
jgi:cell division septation protein DedD